MVPSYHFFDGPPCALLAFTLRQLLGGLLQLSVGWVHGSFGQLLFAVAYNVFPLRIHTSPI